jgi:hypothetical protein
MKADSRSKFLKDYTKAWCEADLEKSPDGNLAIDVEKVVSGFLEVGDHFTLTTEPRLKGKGKKRHEDRNNGRMRIIPIYLLQSQ